MFAEAALLLAAQSITIPLGHPKVIEQPKAPIETSGPLWASGCEGSADRDKSAPPVRIHANSYLVGTCGQSAMLIVGEVGDVLIDAGNSAAAADQIADNIRELGFSPSDIRYILHSDAGPDQLGGVARLQRLSGATVAASPPAAQLLRAGGEDAIQPGRTVHDGDELRLGNILLTAIASPGSSGGLSWAWESCETGVCRSIVYAGNLSAAGGDLGSARSTLARFAASRCEILVTADPAASDMGKRLVLGEPLYDRDACKAYAAKASAALDAAKAPAK